MNDKKASTKYDTKAESNAIAAIKQLPQKPAEQLKSAREVIVGMADLIRSRIANGYTYQQISETLSNAGINVTIGTLRAYLSSANQLEKKQTRSAKTTEEKRIPERKLDKKVTQPQQVAASPPRSAFQDPDEK
ncbi:MAG: hypothetical protein KKF85_02710 [Gammaproteobacteria bacterium]|nr:hypothetical protein [Rhodocyclaceae bacterium]MBU3908738.1 hypothetical protein [Gammaproteobacteria bacterium]MBU4004766.1 hypothetical protein [Gammaproteobacteria bacterium]MBU4021369.1 hypothetical protein [Gammaproteobacteria bacterium]MBU4096386.1 hypothetical protein [Gammaproteobacteria bacterium]